MTGSFEVDGSLALLLVLFGLVMGVVSGLFGVGGGFVIVPLLNLLFGIPYHVAVGSSLCMTVGTSSTGGLRHWRMGNVGPKGTLILAAGAVSGALLGAMSHEWLRHFLVSDGGTHFYDLMMKGLFISLLLPTAWLVYRGMGDHRAMGKTRLHWWRIPPYIRLRRAGIEGVSLPAFTAIGLVVGYLSGLMGIGGGVFLVPVLMLVAGFPPHVAVGTSLGVVLFSAIAGTIAHGWAGNVDIPIAMALLVGSTVGVQVGVAICQRLKAPNLQRHFALFILAVVLFLVWRTIGMIGTAP